MQKYKKQMVALLVVGALLAPVAVFAAAGANVNATDGITGLVNGIKSIINAVMPLIIIIAVVIVIWGAFQIIIGASDEEARAAGRAKILWGLVGVFLALAAWALVSIVENSVNFTGDNSILDANANPTIP